MQYDIRKGDEKSKTSRYSKPHANYKRCMQCGELGHFKCTQEKKSNKVNLTFNVADNLDEFFIDDSDTIKISTKDNVRKRDKKSSRKEAKKHRHRRLSNCNLVIPTSDEESPINSEDNSIERSSSECEKQCPVCAGRHDYEDCQSCRRSMANQKYAHYENVRNRFAQDVGFNYRRENNNRRYVD